MFVPVLSALTATHRDRLVLASITYQGLYARKCKKTNDEEEGDEMSAVSKRRSRHLSGYYGIYRG